MNECCVSPLTRNGIIWPSDRWGDVTPTIIERQDSQTPFLEGTHLGIKRVEARTGFDQSD